MNDNGSPDTRGRDVSMAILRAAVAGYLIYLGYMLIRDHLNGKSTLAPWLSWVCGVFFILAGAGFGWFAWKRYRSETAEKPEALTKTEGEEEKVPELIGSEDRKEEGPEQMPEMIGSEEQAEERPEENPEV